MLFLSVIGSSSGDPVLNPQWNEAFRYELLRCVPRDGRVTITRCTIAITLMPSSHNNDQEKTALCFVSFLVWQFPHAENSLSNITNARKIENTAGWMSRDDQALHFRINQPHREQKDSKIQVCLKCLSGVRALILMDVYNISTILMCKCTFDLTGVFKFQTQNSRNNPFINIGDPVTCQNSFPWQHLTQKLRKNCFEMIALWVILSKVSGLKWIKSKFNVKVQQKRWTFAFSPEQRQTKNIYVTSLLTAMSLWLWV